jgi:hypothetical protein
MGETGMRFSNPHLGRRETGIDRVEIVPGDATL